MWICSAPLLPVSTTRDTEVPLPDPSHRLHLPVDYDHPRIMEYRL